MANTTPADVLFDVRNAFYLGNWQLCLNEAQKSQPGTDDLKLERDVFMYRAYIVQKKYNVVLSEINESSEAVPLKACRLLARYMSDISAKRPVIKEELDSNQTLYMSDGLSSICAATIYFLERNYESALKMLNNSDDLECMAGTVQALLMLDRIDLARKEHKRMCQKDEFHTLSQLCQAWIHIYQNGEKLQDAYLIYQELKDKYGPTPLLLNGQAVALLCQNRWEEAEALLQDASSKEANYTEVIVNQMVLARLLAKATEVQTNRFINQLSDPSQDLTFYQDYEAKQNEFDRIAQQYKMDFIEQTAPGQQ